MKKIKFIFITALLVSCSNENVTEKSIPTVENNNEMVENVVGAENNDEIITGNQVIDDSLKTIEKSIISKEEPTPEIGLETTPEEQISEIPTINFQDYIQWNSFLSNHVSSTGKVNYAKIKSDMIQLDAIIQTFEDNYPSSSWTSQEQLVYWINAYNLYTIKYVAGHYPVSSIKDITAKPWDEKFISLGGETLSLNDIEHKKIRAKYNEPRVHFALNCASESCPMLYNKAFTTKKIATQLTAQTEKFLNDTGKNDFSDPNNIKISSIFDWYKGDFEKKEGSVIAFINKYRTEQLSEPQISYMEYLWGLNN